MNLDILFHIRRFTNKTTFVHLISTCHDYYDHAQKMIIKRSMPLNWYFTLPDYLTIRKWHIRILNDSLHNIENACKRLTLCLQTKHIHVILPSSLEHLVVNTNHLSTQSTWCVNGYLPHLHTFTLNNKLAHNMLIRIMWTHDGSFAINKDVMENHEHTLLLQLPISVCNLKIYRGWITVDFTERHMKCVKLYNLTGRFVWNDSMKYVSLGCLHHKFANNISCKLKSLIIKSVFHKCIAKVQFPDTMKKLYLPYKFNLPFEQPLPSSLRKLKMKCWHNEQSLPINLTHLHLFHQKEQLILPSHVRVFTCYKSDKPLHIHSVKRLTLGYSDNFIISKECVQSLIELRYRILTSSEMITNNYSSHQWFNECCHATQVKKLSYIHMDPINCIYSCVTWLEIDQVSKINFELFPNLRRLYVWHHDKHVQYPNTLKSLKIGKLTCECRLPSQLTKLIINGSGEKYVLNQPLPHLKILKLNYISIPITLPASLRKLIALYCPDEVFINLHSNLKYLH